MKAWGRVAMIDDAVGRRRELDSKSTVETQNRKTKCAQSRSEGRNMKPNRGRRKKQDAETTTHNAETAIKTTGTASGTEPESGWDGMEWDGIGETACAQKRKKIIIKRENR